MEKRITNEKILVPGNKTVLRCLTGRPWSRNLFNKNMRWLLIDNIINMHINTEGVLNYNIIQFCHRRTDIHKSCANTALCIA